MADAELRAQTLARLVDGIVQPFDLLGYLDELSAVSSTVLGLDGAGIVLSTPRRALRAVAASAERRSLLELFELQESGGPCTECCALSRTVEEPDLRTAGLDRWPAFAAAASLQGFSSTVAFPLRVQRECIGALNLFGRQPGPLSDDDRTVGQAMADLAALALLHERFRRERHLVAEQMQAALNNRVLLEQAKGVVAEQLGVDIDAAFGYIQTSAAAANASIGDHASDIVTRRVRVTIPPGSAT